jgi:hypothetical protein
MADKEGTSQRKRYRPLKYLFLNGDLHKVLFISRPKDEIELWNYPKEIRVVATYSDVRKRMEKAFTTTEVAKMLQRHKLTLERAILAGEIESPQFTYGLTEHKMKHAYMWSEEDIMDMHAVLISKHGGRARNDGKITPRRIPNARELRALIRHNTILYTKTDEGFVPTWEAEQF